MRDEPEMSSIRPSSLDGCIRSRLRQKAGDGTRMLAKAATFHWRRTSETVIYADAAFEATSVEDPRRVFASYQCRAAAYNIRTNSPCDSFHERTRIAWPSTHR